MPHENILVLEDHAELREQTCQILAEAGYSVQSAADGGTAIVLARRAPFALLLADVLLPDSSGIEVFEQIRTFQPDIAGVAITGHSTWEMALDALRVGFVGFLVKPVLPEQLLTTIVNALEQEKLRRENARLRALVPLYELSRAFMGTVDLGNLLNQVVMVVQKETRAEVVSLMLLDEDRHTLRIAAAAGLAAEITETQTLALGNGIAGRVAQSGEPLMLAERVALDPEMRGAMNKPEILSALSLPLRSRGQVIGVLNLSRRHGSAPFTSSDLELATVFASQAAIAIDQARLFNQLKQLNDVSQRLARAVDLNEVTAIVLHAPVELMRAHGAALWLSEGTTAPTLKSLGLEGLRVPVPAREKIAEEFVVDGDAGWLTVPLRRGEKNLGALIVRLGAPNPPGEEPLGLLRTVAHTTSAVIESHRLREHEMLAFREVDRAVRTDLNLKEALERLLNEMIGACAAEGGAIFSWDAERDRVEPWVTQGLVVPSDFVRAIIREGRARRLTGVEDARSIVGAPMMTGTRAGGAVVLARSATAGRFDSRHVDLLSTLASTAALIVRNTQLYARSEEAAISEERTRIAREIHDGLAQDLALLVLKISVAEKLLSQGKDREVKTELRAISDQLRRDTRDVRHIIFALRPLDIESQGFLPALEGFAKEFGKANEIELQFEVAGDVSRLPPKLETALFRLTQEALNNIRKHANAKHVWINLSINNRRGAVLRVRDDGQGFDVNEALQAARARGSVGLVQMRERTERAGGVFSIETAPGKGTTIEVQLPVREA